MGVVPGQRDLNHRLCRYVAESSCHKNAESYETPSIQSWLDRCAERCVDAANERNRQRHGGSDKRCAGQKVMSLNAKGVATIFWSLDPPAIAPASPSA